MLITLNVPTEQIRFSVSKNTEETDQLRNQLKQLCKNYLMSLDFRVFGKTLKPSSDKINIAKVSKETDMKETNELRKLAGLEVEAVEDKAYDFEPTPEAEAWYKSIVDHDDLDNMYNQWEEAFSQADTEDKVDVALHHVQGLLADGPLDDYNTLWQAWEQDEDIEDMLPKYQAMAKKSAGTPELPMMGEAEAIKEASLGPVQGSLKTSYQPLDSVKIVVKHSKPVNEEVRGSRSRNISKIFIQANEERFLFPSKNLNGARAMARHIYNGGVMHDSVGESIVNMCKDFGKLKEFIRYVNKKGLVNEENSQYVSLAKEHVENIRTTFKRLSGVKSYANAVESLKDLDVEVVNEVNLEDYFTETHFDEKVGNVHDTLSKLVNKQSAFESYIMNAIENETFDNAKSLIRESDVMTFDSPNARLGYQVSQLGQASASEKLGGYLSGIGNKLSNGGDLNQFEYRAVKASLLSAQNSNPIMAENKTAEQKYEDFIDTFIKSPEPFAQ